VRGRRGRKNGESNTKKKEPRLFTTSANSFRLNIEARDSSGKRDVNTQNPERTGEFRMPVFFSGMQEQV
jgi:hypothetical protein